MIKIGDIANNYGNETALLILLGRLYFKTVKREEVEAFVTGSTIDWALFEKIIHTHQVRPFVFKVISSEAITVDEQFYDKLKNITTRIATGNLAKLNELIRLHAMLNNAGVENIPYKGILLSQTLFGDFISRETADIDFMIRPAGFEKAMQLLLADGYAGKYYYNPVYKKLFLSSDTELLFAKDTVPAKIKVEMHWAVTHKMMNIPFPDARLFNDTTAQKISGIEVQTLSPENTFWVLAIHHGVNDVWRILKHALDISLFVQKHPATDWQKMTTLAGQYRIYKTTHIGFAICRQLFGIEPPVVIPHNEKQVQAVIHNMLRFPPIQRKKLSTENISQQFALRDSFMDKLRLSLAYIATSLQPNMRDVEAMPLPRRWGFLYPLIKPFRLLTGSFNSEGK